MATIKYPEAKRKGRPKGNMLSPEHAKRVRNAVKVAARRFGIRIEDFDPEGAWVVAAMRTSTPLSAEQATRLFRLVQQPDQALIHGREPKGMSLAEAQRAIERFKADPEGNPLPVDLTIDHIFGVIHAAQIVNSYASPLPGSTFFGMPGTALSNAKALVDSFLEEPEAKGMSKAAARRLVEHLTYYFEVAERPLAHPEQEELRQRLGILALANRRELVQATRGLATTESAGEASIVDALIKAERRRSESRAKRAKKKS